MTMSIYTRVCVDNINKIMNAVYIHNTILYKIPSHKYIIVGTHTTAYRAYQYINLHTYISGKHMFVHKVVEQMVHLTQVVEQMVHLTQVVEQLVHHTSGGATGASHKWWSSWFISQVVDQLVRTSHTSVGAVGASHTLNSPHPCTHKSSPSVHRRPHLQGSVPRAHQTRSDTE